MANALHVSVWLCLYVNLVGRDRTSLFDGGSFVVDARSRLRRHSAFFEERDLVMLEEACAAHGATFPGTEEEVYRALVMGT